MMKKLQKIHYIVKLLIAAYQVAFPWEGVAGGRGDEVVGLRGLCLPLRLPSQRQRRKREEEEEGVEHSADLVHEEQ